ncbi:hypothetical protein [Nocardia sp. NPDC004750]
MTKVPDTHTSSAHCGPIDDEIAVQVADAFYAALVTDPDVTDAAYALHRAIQAVRDALPATPLLWAAYLHPGA